MLVRRSTLMALVLGAFLIGWLLPAPVSTAQQVSPDTKIVLAPWAEQIESKADRNTALIQAIVWSMPSTDAFYQALNRVADDSEMPDEVQRQAREVLEATGRRARE